MSHCNQHDFQHLMSQLLDESADIQLGRMQSEDIHRIAIACSGGLDSMALCHLLREWCETCDIHLTALIVDHGLREASATEAMTVKDRLEKAGIEAIILKDENVSIENNIQSRARSLRYGLMLDWCQTHAVGYLCLGHHKDDQAETFMLRLARGSGAAGLSAMKGREVRRGITLLRPLLSESKSNLRDFLRKKKISWVEDPSNRKNQFDRVKIRNLAPKLAKIGLTAERLSKTAQVMSDTQAALDWSLSQMLRDHIKIYDVGCYAVEKQPLSELPKALVLRVFSLMLASASGQVYPPELSRLEQIYEHFLQAGYAATCHGAQLHSRGKTIWIGRELSRIDATRSVLCNGPVLWDGRFLVSDFPEDWLIRPLGPQGWAHWCKRNGEDKKACPYPAFIRNGVPSAFSEEELVAPLFPLFGKQQAKDRKNSLNFRISFKIPPQFHDFTFSTALSHTM